MVSETFSSYGMRTGSLPILPNEWITSKDSQGLMGAIRISSKRFIARDDKKRIETKKRLSSEGMSVDGPSPCQVMMCVSSNANRLGGTPLMLAPNMKV